MGRASRCLRSIFTKSTKQINNKSNTTNTPKWITALVKSCRDNRGGAATANSVVSVGKSAHREAIARGEDVDESAPRSFDGYAIVDEYSFAAASDAAEAAVEVVRIGRLDFDPSCRAAVRIQSVFRCYLARKALRALRALVRLQALVRGYIVRKRAVDQARRMHALIRAQARARAIRAPVPASSYSSSRTSHSCILDPLTPEDSEYAAQVWSSVHDHSVKTQLLQRNSSKSNREIHLNHSKLGCGTASSRRFDEGNIDKIVEVDSSAKPYNSTKNKNLFLLSDYYDRVAYETPPIPNPSEDLYLKYSNEIDRYSFYTANDIPQSHTGSFRSISARRGGHIAPADVNYSESYLIGYQDHPNYMAYTQSSKAKMRSVSAPKQRTQLDRSTSLKCCSSHDYGSRRLSASGAS